MTSELSQAAGRWVCADLRLHCLDHWLAVGHLDLVIFVALLLPAFSLVLMMLPGLKLQ